MTNLDSTGARTPDARPSPPEQEVASAQLARTSRPGALLGVIAGALLASVAFGLLMLTLLGLLALLYMGVTKLALGEIPSVPPAARPAVRTGMLLLAGFWTTAFTAVGLRMWTRERRRLRLIAGGDGPPRTVATFRATRFNTTEHKPSFINEGCFGDDVVQLLLDGLVSDGHPVDDEPGAEDFGWYGRFRTGPEDVYDLIVSFQPENDEGDGRWWVHVERSGTPLSSNRRQRGGEVQREASSAVHDVLARTDGVEDLSWFFDGESADRAQAA